MSNPNPPHLKDGTAPFFAGLDLPLSGYDFFHTVRSLHTVGGGVVIFDTVSVWLSLKSGTFASVRVGVSNDSAPTLLEFVHNVVMVKQGSFPLKNPISGITEQRDFYAFVGSVRLFMCENQKVVVEVTLSSASDGNSQIRAGFSGRFDGGSDSENKPVAD